MRPAERRERILAWLGRGSARVEELAEALDVTESTIRRDLSRLTADGRITRTYGGALAAPDRLPEPSLHQRELLARPAKDAIARHAARLVAQGQTILLDAGTTTGRLAHHLRSRAPLTVITCGLTTVTELADATDVELVVLGGQVRHLSQGLVGPLAEQTLRRLTADAAFLGADGLVADRGICEAESAQTALKELMAAQASEVYVLADSSKLGRAPFGAWAPLDRPWTLITDQAASTEQLAPFRAHEHITVQIAARRSARTA